MIQKPFDLSNMGADERALLEKIAPVALQRGMLTMWRWHGWPEWSSWGILKGTWKRGASAEGSCGTSHCLFGWAQAFGPESVRQPYIKAFHAGRILLPWCYERQLYAADRDRQVRKLLKQIIQERDERIGAAAK